MQRPSADGLFSAPSPRRLALPLCAPRALSYPGCCASAAPRTRSVPSAAEIVPSTDEEYQSDVHARVRAPPPPLSSTFCRQRPRPSSGSRVRSNTPYQNRNNKPKVNSRYDKAKAKVSEDRDLANRNTEVINKNPEDDLENMYEALSSPTQVNHTGASSSSSSARASVPAVIIRT